ncbi:MAG: hypothetical protein OSA99_13025 [Acidimicrobiales bacterium]|nr:hypothetical protein [Acidimicrobiales bacterium]
MTIFVAVLAVGFLAAAGLAYDGSQKLGGLAQARDLADNAARACAQGVDAEATLASGAAVLDAADAEARALAYLSTVGISPVAVIVGPASCEVEVELSVQTRFLPGPFRVSATEQATALYGVEAAR